MKEKMKRILAKLIFAAIVSVIVAFWNPIMGIIQSIINGLFDYREVFVIRMTFWFVILFALTNFIWNTPLEKTIYIIIDKTVDIFKKIKGRYCNDKDNSNE